MTPEGGPVRLAGRALDIPLRDRILFGSGRIADLPAAVVAAGGRRAFLVTDPAINNSPRLSDAAQVEAILRSVAG